MSILSGLFHRKPETVQAIQFDGTLASAQAIERFTGGRFKPFYNGGRFIGCLESTYGIVTEVTGAPFWIIKESEKKYRIVSNETFRQEYEQ